MSLRRRFIKSLILVLVSLAGLLMADRDSFESWTQGEAVALLNRSAWASQETFTRVIGGIGSGIQGEKEIYSTYFVRLLSALPIRQAFARIHQIQLGYDQLGIEQRKEIDSRLEPGLKMDVADWIIVAVAFRSNNQRQQSQIEQFFKDQTIETFRQRAFLSSERFPRVSLSAYYPPKETAVGAKFVFPRRLEGTPVVGEDDEQLVFELDVPFSNSELRVEFSVSDMLVEGELVL